MAEYLGLADVIAIHQHIMARLGSNPAPFRAGGEGLLESAVMRPQMAAHYEDADLVRQAALLAVGISQAQAFIDGNKRTAFAVLKLFLNLNDHELIVDPLVVARELERVAEAPDRREAGEAFE